MIKAILELSGALCFVGPLFSFLDDFVVTIITCGYVLLFSLYNTKKKYRNVKGWHFALVLLNNTFFYLIIMFYKSSLCALITLPNMMFNILMVHKVSKFFVKSLLCFGTKWHCVKWPRVSFIYYVTPRLINKTSVRVTIWQNDRYRPIADGLIPANIPRQLIS